MKKLLLASALAASLLSACSGSDAWHIEGYAPDGVDTVCIMAPAMGGGWYAMDSVATKKGRFNITLPRANGSIYRVDLGPRSVYVPADSTETITLAANGQRSGSVEAALFNSVDSVIAAGGDARAMLLTLEGNYASTAAYYATRVMRNRLLLRTVTNRHVEERPADPRTALLRAELTKITPVRTDSTPTQQVILANEIGYYDIELMDRNGQMQRLSSVVESNPLTLLAYVDFTADDPQALTRTLGDAQSAGAAIYEIGFSNDQFQWAAASQGLPWVNVYQSDAADRTHIGNYAVGAFPTFFLIKNGEIVERLNDPAKLIESINNHK